MAPPRVLESFGLLVASRPTDKHIALVYRSKRATHCTWLGPVRLALFTPPLCLALHQFPRTTARS